MAGKHKGDRHDNERGREGTGQYQMAESMKLTKHQKILWSFISAAPSVTAEASTKPQNRLLFSAKLPIAQTYTSTAQDPYSNLSSDFLLLHHLKLN